MKYILEICTDTVLSAIDAMNAGARRIELCDNLGEGGTTPSYGTILKAKEMLSIPVHVIIRPRGGDFLYNPIEYDIMREDIIFCKKAGIDGIVTGMLTPGGNIDTLRFTELVELARPMQTTFHRAFDMCSDPFRALEDIAATGASRLLTSGQKNKAVEGSDLIAQLIRSAGDSIIIMPGSGIDKTNIESIARRTGAAEFHLTGRKVIQSEMIFRRGGIEMGGIHGLNEYTRKVADADHIKEIAEILNSL
jgi:copper homeostasis protein